MSKEYTLVRHQTGGEKFEILVDPEKGLEYKRGEISEIRNALMIDTIFTDANKGEKASAEKLEKHYVQATPLKSQKRCLKKALSS